MKRFFDNKIEATCNRHRSGSLLIVVLVTIVILSLSAYTFTAMMQTEEEATRLMSRRVQSKYLVDSGVDYARLFLSYDKDTVLEKGGLWDNIDVFQNVPVAFDPDEPNIVGRFTMIVPGIDDNGVHEGHRYGLFDESAKLNLNILPYVDPDGQTGSARTLLMALPNMEEDIADAIIDWIDSDDNEREYGAESSVYSSLSPPYECKNGPLDSLDELLLIQGVSPELLFGLDANRNGILDNDENAQNSTSLGSEMLLGWANYLTLYSKETNLTFDGQQRININSEDLETLYDDLRSVLNEEWSQFIIRCRISGISPASQIDPADVPQRVALVPLDLANETSVYEFQSLMDLIDAYTTIPDVSDGASPDAELPFPSPLNSTDIISLASNLPNVMKNLTTVDRPDIPGRINIMQASRLVLEGIPGMTTALVDAIIEKREFELDQPNGADRNYQYPTWLLIDGLCDVQTMKSLYGYICTKGDVYKAEIVGYFDDGVGTSRAEVILDHTLPIPRILFWRDKSHLSAGHSIEILGLDLDSQ